MIHRVIAGDLAVFIGAFSSPLRFNLSNFLTISSSHFSFFTASNCFELLFFDSSAIENTSITSKSPEKRTSLSPDPIESSISIVVSVYRSKQFPFLLCDKPIGNGIGR